MLAFRKMTAENRTITVFLIGLLSGTLVGVLLRSAPVLGIMVGVAVGAILVLLLQKEPGLGEWLRELFSRKRE